MSGIFWHIITFAAAGIFLVLIIYRIVAISRLPEHLRWELAPVPTDKGKVKYGGSYVEDFEWWQRPRRKTRISPLIYMVREIFLFRGVWKNNRPLWPFSFTLHMGIFLFILALVLYPINALLIITDAALPLQETFLSITAVVVATGCISGIIGSVGLILQRSLNTGVRNFSSFSTFFRLFFMAAVFITGAIAMLDKGNYAAEMSVFIKNLITLDSGVSVPAISAVHLIISLLFIIYLPFTDMAHFIIKHFTYYAVRWNDAPQDSRMKEKLRLMMAQPIGWPASHAESGGSKKWADLAGNNGEKTKP